MLHQIRCVEYPRVDIQFHKGLNVVMGADDGANSIGKSMSLMVIDFMLGGDSYPKVHKDAIEHLGHHSFQATFNFSGELLCIERSTRTPKNVHICTSTFHHLATLKNEDFCRILAEKYYGEIPHSTFREITGRYLRIYGKSNLDEKNPLSANSKEKAQSAIAALIKLFRAYDPIHDELQLITSTDTQLTGIKALEITALIQKLTNKEYKALCVQVDRLEAEIDEFQKSSQLLVAPTAQMSDYLLSLSDIQTSLTTRLNILKHRQRRLTNTTTTGPELTIEQRRGLEEFFPNLNTKSFDEVANFHSKVQKFLALEIKSALSEINQEIDTISKAINENALEIEGHLGISLPSSSTVESLTRKIIELHKLKENIRVHLLKQKMSAANKAAKTNLSTIYRATTTKIEKYLNSKILALCIAAPQTQITIPTLKLEEKKYSLQTKDDTGTGTAFANLIFFDLAVLNHTALPMVAHDLPLFKNIQNTTLSHIFNIYSRSEKQIFITIDKLNSYTQDLQILARKNTVLTLSKSSVLFGQKWS